MTNGVLLSFLGTTDYQEVMYNIDGTTYKTRFFSHALTQHYRDYQLKVLMTNEAQAKHGAALAELCSFDEVLVSSGKTETELWEMFSRIAEAIPDHATLVIDVTHGFRSQPMLALAVVLYLRVVKRIELRRILYGAFEAKDAQGVAPVFDLTPFVDLIDWAVAAQQFSRYGNAAPLRDLLHKIHKGTHVQQLPYRPQALQSVGEKLAELSSALAINRPAEALQVAKELARRAEGLQRDVASIPSAAPLGLLLDRIQARLEPLARAQGNLFTSEGFRAQAAILRFYLDTELYAQAITLSREALISKRCIDQGKRALEARSKVERDLNELSRSMRHGKPPPQELHELVKLWGELGDLRNDINHAGMRPQPQPTQTSISNITRLCEQPIALLEGM